ncbi:MAG: hypothetical protein JXA67_04950 [Micromonosporaceae bacterium]|nr:hypothetical protein [Micromonosporaceae bacterium]
MTDESSKGPTGDREAGEAGPEQVQDPDRTAAETEAPASTEEVPPSKDAHQPDGLVKQAVKDVKARGISDRATEDGRVTHPGLEGDQDSPEAIDERHWAAESGRDVFSGARHRLRDVDNSGALAQGDHATAVNVEVLLTSGMRETRVRMSELGERWVKEQYLEPFVATGSFTELRAKLCQHRVVVVLGEPGSGRRTIAFAGLALPGRGDGPDPGDPAPCQPADVVVLEAEPGIVLSDLQDDTLLSPGKGHMLDVTGTPLRRATLEAFAALARRQRAYLVLLAGKQRQTDEHLGPFGFNHAAPDPEEVLRRHVTVRLTMHAKTCEEGCDQWTVDDYATRRIAELRDLGHPLPTDMATLVAMAASIAGAVHSEVPIRELVRLSEQELRQLAREALITTEEEAEAALEAQRRQAFRIAYAVFHGHPLSDAFDAGELLSGQILPLFEHRETAPTHVVFDAGLDKLLYRKMYLDGGHKDGESPGARRNARLVDSALAPMMLDVAWHDFAATRGPIQAWLDVLAGADRARVQVRAAQVAGVLATFDFETVYGTLIGRWARGNARYRQSAALAMDLAATEDRLAARIRRQVLDWRDSPNPFLQDTAAKVYGTRIGASMPEDAIRSLRKLAEAGELQGSSSMAMAMAMLYGSGSPELVLDELVRWAAEADDCLRQHAVLVLLALAKLAGPKAKGPWPPVLPLVADHPERQGALVRLWRHALVGSRMAARSWEPLRRWMVAADAEPDQADLVVALAARMLANREERVAFDFRLRAGFHLGRWRQQYPDCAVIRRVYEEIGRD